MTGVYLCSRVAGIQVDDECTSDHCAVWSHGMLVLGSPCAFAAARRPTPPPLTPLNVFAVHSPGVTPGRSRQVGALPYVDASGPAGLMLVPSATLNSLLPWNATCS